MRRFFLVLLLGCHGGSHAAIDAAPTPDAPTDAPGIDAPPDAPPDAGIDPRLMGIYNEVDGAHLAQLVKDMSGVNPVTVGTDTFTIDERFSDTGRAHWRAYWTSYMQGLGLTVRELDYTSPDRPGVDLEALLPGPKADSYVVIVHYDSIGPPGQETMNPGADDDMTGMAIEMETARILVAHQAELGVSVRFVASDQEELGGLSGARAYAKDIQQLATTQGFQIIGAIDDEQSGWNCHADHACITTAPFPDFDVFSCGTGKGHTYNYQALGDQFAEIAKLYSPTHVTRDCMGENSDHFAMWEIGVPTLVYSEHDPFVNPHFDQEGGDLFSTIDTDYFTNIARVGITFQASQVIP